MPFSKEQKTDSDIEDLLMYELVNMMQINFAKHIAERYQDKLFEYYMKSSIARIDSEESYMVQSFFYLLIEKANLGQKIQLVYDSIEDRADEFMREIFEGLSQRDENFLEMMKRINPTERCES